MKLKNIIYGMMCVAALGSCSDKMEYHEYNNYDEDFVKLNFGNVGGRNQQRFGFYRYPECIRGCLQPR